ncbi:MAG TPA: phosphoglycerate kinase, partial [Candidatus Eisenbacteria bacterium]|nr:phosphoglycerate kinase [Candidatus Eisenbacteria bacterium]
MISHGFNIKTIEDEPIIGKTVLVRVDFDVSFKALHKIADDTRLRESLATILYLLKHRNKLILVSKLGRPEKRDKDHSMNLVEARLKHYLPLHKITVVDDFLDPKSKSIFENQKQSDILLLENIRFYPEEEKNDDEFAKKLAALADVYVIDAFAMMHRKEATIVGVPKYLPSFAGLLLAKEIASIAKVVEHPLKPFVAIVGGAKIPDKLA